MKKYTLVFLAALMCATVTFAQTSSKPTKQDALDFIRNKIISYGLLDNDRKVVIDYNNCTMAIMDYLDGGGNCGHYINFSNLNGNTIRWTGSGSHTMRIASTTGHDGSWDICSDGSGHETKQYAEFTFYRPAFDDPNFKQRIEKAFVTAIIYCGGEYKEEKF